MVFHTDLQRTAGSDTSQQLTETFRDLSTQRQLPTSSCSLFDTREASEKKEAPSGFRTATVSTSLGTGFIAVLGVLGDSSGPGACLPQDNRHVRDDGSVSSLRLLTGPIPLRQSPPETRVLDSLRPGPPCSAPVGGGISSSAD